MSVLKNIVTGKKVGPQIHTIAGNNGVGKTTWAASFPKALILDLERGSNHLNVSRLTPDHIQDFEALKSILKELAELKHDYQSLVIDSAEALEGLISDYVCREGKVESIEKYEGGYGKGYSRTRELMREIMIALQNLQSKGITSILVAHTQVKSITDPATNQTYDRVIMRCNDKMAAIIRDLSDNVFYATHKVFTTETKGKVRAFGDGQRVMYTQWRPGFEAKNRLDLPHELPLSYDAFIEAQGKESDVETVLADINEIAGGLDEKLKSDVQAMIEKFKNNPVKLKEVKNRLMKYAVA